MQIDCLVVILSINFRVLFLVSAYINTWQVFAFFHYFILSYSISCILFIILYFFILLHFVWIFCFLSWLKLFMFLLFNFYARSSVRVEILANCSWFLLFILLSWNSVFLHMIIITTLSIIIIIIQNKKIVHIITSTISICIMIVIL